MNSWCLGGGAFSPLHRFGIVIAMGFGALTVATLRPLQAQDRPILVIEKESGSTSTVTVQFDRGYASVAASVLSDIGWSVNDQNGTLVLTAAGEIKVSFRYDSPFFRWDGVVLQMADSPYVTGGLAWLPLQFLTDFLPRRLPGLYDFSSERSLLRAANLELLVLDDPIALDAEDDELESDAESGQSELAHELEAAPEVPFSGAVETTQEEEQVLASSYEDSRVVVIDAGHGGEDPGALSATGVREKTIALAIALEIEKALSEESDLEVHMIRDEDRFVDVWARGLTATEWKGERPGVFLSIHANSFPARREARGFETYFLSDARTDDERRVSAIENAPLNISAPNIDEERLADMDFILRDLRNYEHAHWSESLATLVQNELAEVHPGPNRGVKQGPLAVLTNALMPSVLIEVGFLSNESDLQLLRQKDFHQSSGRAIAEAVIKFLRSYPPGSSGGGDERRR